MFSLKCSRTLPGVAEISRFWTGFGKQVSDWERSVQGMSHKKEEMSWIISLLLQITGTLSGLWKEIYEGLVLHREKPSFFLHLNSSHFFSFLPSDIFGSAGSTLLEEVTLGLFYCRSRRQLERVIAAKTCIICSLNISMELLRLKKGTGSRNGIVLICPSVPSVKSVAFTANSARAILCLLYWYRIKQMVNL